MVTLTLEDFLSIFPEFASKIPVLPTSDIRIQEFSFETDRFTRTINLTRNIQATLQYVQIGSSDVDERGRWILTLGQLANPFSPKTISSIKFKEEGGSLFLTSPLEVDSSSTNALSYHSTNPYTANPSFLSGSSDLTLQYNLILNDDSLVFDDVPPAVPAERLRFQSFMDALLDRSKNWESYLTRLGNSLNDATLKRIHALLIAHIASLVFLNKEAGGQVAGDEASVSTGEGGLNISTGRVEYGQFLRDPYLSRTRYGAELAFYLRSAGPAFTSAGLRNLAGQVIGDL